MNYIYIGKIVNTHGIKGEIRILSDFKYKEKIFKKGYRIYIGKNKEEQIINSYRYHKIFDMITLKGINNINDVLIYKGKNIYINRNELQLSNDEYLNEDLIGLNVIINNKIVGKVTKYLKDKYQDKIVVNKKEKEYLIPNVSGIIKNINLQEGNIEIENIKGLID